MTGLLDHLAGASLDTVAYTAEARDTALAMLLTVPGGLRAYVAAVLAADPTWRHRRHVTRGLGVDELQAARDADARTLARVGGAR